ncbi:MAG: DUF5011 domain-containing protein [Bacteroidetes bacterium]|nr:DUF5011 domain-containing protein [Bacteroidota bacterium]
MALKNRPIFLGLLLTILVVACQKTDKTPPVVVVLEPEYRVPLGQAYQERGALGTDKEDGVLDTAAVTADASRVRTDSVGEYPVYYYVADAAGNEDSATRFVAVYARTQDYTGNWAVRDSCDSILINYTAVAVLDPLDSTRVAVSNWRNRGSSYQMHLQILGRLGNSITLNDSLSDFTYVGNSVLTYGTTTRFAFDLPFDEIDSVSFQSCVSQFRKP